MIRSQVKSQIKTVHCPYVPEHIMPESSLLNHLTKCSFKNKHLFTKCRYNPIHVYPKDLIQDHYKKCKDREKYEKKNNASSDDWDSGKQETNQEVVESKVRNPPPNRKREVMQCNQSRIQRKARAKDSDDGSDDQYVPKDSASRSQASVNTILKDLTLTEQKGVNNKSKVLNQSKINSSVNSFVEIQSSRKDESFQNINQDSNFFKKENFSQDDDPSAVKSDSFESDDDKSDKKEQASTSKAKKVAEQNNKSRDNDKSYSKTENPNTSKRTFRDEDFFQKVTEEPNKSGDNDKSQTKNRNLNVSKRTYVDEDF